MLRGLRFLLACLLLAALPLKGYAAASMLLCQPGQAAVAQAQTAGLEAVASHPHGNPQGHADAHHGSSRGAHHHAAHDGHPLKAAQGGADAPVPGATSTDGHLCGVCALCCHGLALSGVAGRAADAAPAPAPAFAPPTHLSTRGLPVPDKPPRG